MAMTDAERLRYLELKQKAARAVDTSYLSNQITPSAEPGEPSFFQGVKAGLTAQPGEGVGYFVGSAIPAGVGGALGGPVGAALGEVARQTAGAIVNPEATAQKSALGIGASVAGAGVGQKIGEVAGPVIGKGVSKAGQAVKSVSDWFASKVGKSFLKASKNLNAYGHEPSKAITTEKIVATSWDDLVDKAKSAKKAVGKEIDETINKYPQDKITNIEEVVAPIDDALEEALKMPTENATLVSRLEGIKQDVLNLVSKTAQESKGVGIKEANELKKTLYKVTKYTGNTSDDIVANKVKQQVARNLADKIEDVAPEIKAIHRRFGNLVALENAATNRAIVAERNNIFGLPEMFATGIAGVGGVSGIAPAAGLVLASRGIQTPIGATAAIQAASGIGRVFSQPEIAAMASQISQKLGGAVSPAIVEQIIPMIQMGQEPANEVKE